MVVEEARTLLIDTKERYAKLKLPLSARKHNSLRRALMLHLGTGSNISIIPTNGQENLADFGFSYQRQTPDDRNDLK